MQNLLPLPRMGSIVSGLPAFRFTRLIYSLCQPQFLHGRHVQAKQITTLKSDHVRSASHPIPTTPDEV